MPKNVELDFLSGLDDRAALVDKLKQKLEGLPQNEANQVNLKPLMQWADSLAGTSTAQGYEQPKSKLEELKMKLQQQIDKEKQGIADDQLKYLQGLQSGNDTAEKAAYRNAMLRIAMKRAENSGLKEPRITGEEFKAAGFAKRIKQSGEVLEDLLSQGYISPSRKEQFMSILPTEMQNENYKKYNQAVQNFINATLREESGAAIGEKEFDNARKQYLPQPGDSAEVLAQKKANREQVFENFKTEGERAYQKIPYVNPIGQLKAPKANKKVVSNGAETLEIDPEDLDQALAEGFKEVSP